MESESCADLMHPNRVSLLHSFGVLHFTSTLEFVAIPISSLSLSLSLSLFSRSRLHLIGTRCHRLVSVISRVDYHASTEV